MQDLLIVECLWNKLFFQAACTMYSLLLLAYIILVLYLQFDLFRRRLRQSGKRCSRVPARGTPTMDEWARFVHGRGAPCGYPARCTLRQLLHLCIMYFGSSQQFAS